MRSRRAALYSSSVIMPFLRRASRVVSESWKSVRSWSLGGIVTLLELPALDEDVCCSAGAAAAAGSAAASERAIAGTSASAATREKDLPVTSASLGWTRANDCTNRSPDSRPLGPAGRERSCRAASGRLLAGPIPAQARAHDPVDGGVHHHRETRQEEHRHERLVVMESPRLKEDVEAESIDGNDEFGHHCTDEGAAHREPDTGDQVWQRRRQGDAEPDLVRAGPTGARHLEIFGGNGARAVGDVHGDREEGSEDDGGETRRGGVAEPDGEQRDDGHHRHGIEPVDVEG